MSLCTEVEGLEGRADQRVLPRGRPLPVVNGTEGRAGYDYVPCELALPCARIGADVPPGDAGVMASGAPRGRFVEGGYHSGCPVEKSVA